MKTLNFPVSERKERGHGGDTLYVKLECPGTNLMVIAYSEKEAREKLTKTVHESLQHSYRMDRNPEKHIAYTGDGHVFLVYFAGEKWAYSICGQDQTYGSSTFGFDTKEGAIKSMQNHAQQCFGGITWQHSLI